MRSHLMAAAIAAVLLTSASPGQSPATMADAGIPSSIGSIGVVPIHALQGRDGPEVWAATDSYKVRFDRGPRFVPYLGNAYPRPRSLAWRTLSVRVGSQELVRESARAERWHSDTRFEYRYGAVTEAYDVLAEGLEQTFVIHERPAGSGDLVVTGRVETSLVSPPSGDAHQVLDFADEGGRDVVRYGKAWVLDAAGVVAPIETGYRNGRIVLTVGTAWLDRARFPITIDPLLTRIQAMASGDFGSVDVARDELGDDIMVVFTRAASGSDHDVYARLYRDDWSGGTTVFSDLSTNDSPHVRVAVSGQVQRYCIAYDVRFYHPLISGWLARLRYHLHDSGDFALRTSYTALSPPSGTHEWRPDVGGLTRDPSVTTGAGVPPLFFLVFQRESRTRFTNTDASQVWWRRIDELGVANTPQQLAPVSPGAVDQERPTINSVSRGRFIQVSALLINTDWLVAWQERDPAPATPAHPWSVAGRLIVHGFGAIPASQGWLSTGGFVRSHHRMGPRVTRTEEGGYVVVFTRSPLSAVPGSPAATEGHSVQAERVGWRIQGTFPASRVPVNHPEQTVAGPFPTARVAVGGCAGGSSHWAFSTHSLRSAGGTGNVHVTRVGHFGHVTENAVLHGSPAGHQGEAGGVVFDPEGRLWIAGWTMGNTSSEAAYANKFVFRSAAQPTVSGSSCAISSPSYGGTQQIGSTGEKVLLTGAHPNGIAILLVALAPADVGLGPLGMPFCRQLVAAAGPGYVGLLVGTTDGNGRAAMDLPLPGILQPASLYFQWFHAQPLVNPRNLVSTQRLVVPVVK